MPEHYTRNTISVWLWCDKCRSLTEHRVDDGRRGPCLEHSAPTQEKRPVEEKQKDLFEQ
jgi:hypothetical protein